MFKLNFEKSVIFVLMLIVIISTANIFRQYIDVYFTSKEHTEVKTDITQNIGFPARILKADQAFKLEQYREAQGEYFKLTSMPNLSQQQKATVYFKLGICNYRLKEYGLARDSFLKAAEFNGNDSVSYNNAAVCSFHLNDYDKAEELQKLAVASLPVIEYHYNMARIYEAWGKYEESVKYFTAVTRAEENITREDRIDPVRIKNKVIKLMTNLSNIEDLTNELMIALKLKDVREVFIIDDANMDIKNKNFEWSIVKENGDKRLYCSYERQESDPYSLIDSMKWTVIRGGKTVYTGKKDKFSLSIVDGEDYIVNLDIAYNTNMKASSYAEVFKSSTEYSGSVISRPSTNPIAAPSFVPAEGKCKYYEYALYEQVFEKSFNISEKGYVDRFNVVWGKDEIITRMDNKDIIDAQYSLYMKNILDRRSGIWADLSSLIKDKELNGKTVKIKFFAKKESEDAVLHVSIKTKTGEKYGNKIKRYTLDDKWQQFSIELSIPEKADGLTISLKTGVWESLKIDGFIVTK